MILLGYTFLIRHFDIELPRLGIELQQGAGNRDEIKDFGSFKVKYLAASKKYKTTVPAQIEVAIKYQGIRLPYLALIFKSIDVAELTAFIAEKPTGKIRRAIWFLYEWYTGDELDLSPLSKSPYIPLMDSKYYFTREHGSKCPRTKVINNMLGNRDCSPTVRKTKAITKINFEEKLDAAEKKLQHVNKLVSTEQLGRSLNYLYLKETKSSTEIEREDSNQSRTNRFYQVLKSAGSIPLSKQRLLTIQNQIVPANKGDTDYRNDEIWVGENVRMMGGVHENIHYIGPTKTLVPTMMDGLLQMHEQLLLETKIPVLVHAAVVSFMFVYIHPFSDGNGRTHRYLIHDIVKSRRPKDDFIVPVSSAILNNMKEYDATLETLSKPMMALLQYELNEEGTLSIENSIDYLYQFPDLTAHALFLSEMMAVAINEELISEILYILAFDSTKQQINEEFDCKEKDLSNYVNWLMQSEGKFGNRKRKQVAKQHSEADISRMENIATIVLQKHYELLAQLESVD